MKKQVIFTTEGNITESDKKKLSKNGVMVIDVKNLVDVKFQSDLDTDIIFESSIEALKDTYDSHKAKFFNLLYTKLKSPQKIA